jgi:Undecaprenyl-phosphate glucose phosphotransferase
MIKDRQSLLNKMHVVLDALVIVLAYVLAYVLRFIIIGAEMFQYNPRSIQAYRYYSVPLLILVPGLLILYALFGLYSPKRVMGRRKELVRIFAANVIGILLFITGLYLIKTRYFYSGYMIFYFAVYNISLMIIERCLIRIILAKLRRNGFNQKHILLVGYSSSAESLIDRVKAHSQWGYQIHGILDDHRKIGDSYKGIEVIGRLEELESILEANRLDEIMITLKLSEYTKLAHVVAATEKSGVHTKFIPDYSNVIPTSPYTEDLLGLPVINIRHVPLMEGGNKFIKRSMDLVGSLLCIVLFSPIMLICVAGVKLSSKGPVIFCQERVGLHNRPFKMYKFRSMTVQTDEEEKGQWTTKGDARVTGIGRIMRATSMDELPQLFNVLKGDMSLIGPRPERPFFVEQFKEQIPRYMVKHQVRPGMTGWAQVNGYRGDTSIEKRIEYDLYYIENWTVGLDIKILFMTVFKGFINENAY